MDFCPQGRFLRRRSAAYQRERAVYRAPAPVRRFLPERIDGIWNRQIDPGEVSDLTLPLGRVAEGYRAMDERRHRGAALSVGHSKESYP